MLRSSTLGFVASTLVALCSLAAAPAVAQESWPSKPIRMIVPFPPGGSNDVIGRRLALDLSKRLDQPVVIDNRGGGGGSVGAGVVATSPSDGYTLLFVSSSLATSAAVQKLPYDPVKSFDPVSRVASAPFVIVTRTDFPARNIKELVDYAKANPGKLNYGSAGVGDNSALATEFLNSVAGVQITAVNYRGTGPALLDLVAGRIDMTITSIASLRGTVADKLPMLAFTGEQREADYPAVPTVKESGLNYVVDLWWGVFAPAGVPPKIRDRLNMEIASIVKTPEFASFLKTAGANPSASTSEELRAQLEQDVHRWTATARKAGIAPQ